MAEYLIQEETLTALGDKIRVLNGTEDTMTPAVMNSELASANEEVDAQSALIDQLSELLEGKAAGGSDSESNVVSINVSFYDNTSGLYCYCNANGEFIESEDEGIIEAKGGAIISKFSYVDISGGAYYDTRYDVDDFNLKFYIFNSNNATLVLKGELINEGIPEE